MALNAMGMQNSGKTSSGSNSSSFISTLVAKMPFTYRLLQSAVDQNPKYDIFNRLATRPAYKAREQSLFQQQPETSGVGDFAASDKYSRFIYADIDADKVRRVQEYRRMAAYAEVADCIDEIADEAIVKDNNGDVIKFALRSETHDKVIVKDLQKEWKKFIDVFDWENKGWEYIRQFLIEGELYFENVISLTRPDYGIINVVNIPTELINPVYDNIQNQIIEGFLFRKPILDLQRQSSSGQLKEEIVAFEKGQVSYINSGLWNEDRTVRLPYIENARRAYKQLSLVEDAIIIYRLVRAPERLVFKVDVGNMPVPKAEEYVRKLMQQYWSRKNFDASQNRVTNTYDPQSMLDAYWFTKRGQSEGTTVEQLPGGCLAMDTLIPLLDGRRLTLAQMTEEYNAGKENWVYSCNPTTGAIVPGLVSWAGVTQKSAKVLRLTFDNNESVVCTLDHKYPILGRGEVEAKDLVVGDSMIPFNTQEHKLGNSMYEQVYQNDTRVWEYTHRMVVRELITTDIIKEFVYNELYVNADKDTIHHKDYDRHNNSPSNLVRMNNQDHRDYHSSLKFTPMVGTVAAQKRLQDIKDNQPDVYKQLQQAWSEQAAAVWSSLTVEEREQRVTNITKGINEYITGLTKEEKAERDVTSKQNRRKGNDKLSALYADPEFAARAGQKISASLKATLSAPEQRERISKQNVDMWKNPERKTAHAKRNSDRWKDPAFADKARKNMSLVFSRESVKALIDVVTSTKLVKQQDVVTYVNTTENSLMKQFKQDNPNTKIWSGVLSKTLIKRLVESAGYKNYAQFRKEMMMYNHRITKIEYLDNPIEVGTLTIDQNETYHNFHNFALCCGVFTKNSNLGQLDDLMYFVRKLYKALKVPQQRLDPQNVFQDGEQITREELRFARFIIRVQCQIAAGIKSSFITHLKLREKIPDDDTTKSKWEVYKLRENHIHVEFNMPSSFAVIREQQIFDLKKNNFTGLVSTELMSQSYCQKQYLGMTTDQMAENREWLRKDAALSWEIQQIIANGPAFRAKLAAEIEMEKAAAGAATGGVPMGGTALPEQPEATPAPANDVPPDFGPGPETAAAAPQTPPPANNAPSGN